MFQSFLFFISPRIRNNLRSSPSFNLDRRLQDLGYRVLKTDEEKVADSMLPKMDALILCSPAGEIDAWSNKLLSDHALPLIWACYAERPSDGDCRLETEIDGMISVGMSDHEVHWALQLSSNRFLQRIQWIKEREQLMYKLEERKWIEKAKAILVEIKKISEPEAYEFLRKQAMNERKRVADVAASIVKVYPLLQESKGDGSL